MSTQSKMKKPVKLTPWQRIVRAYEAGRGVHLSFEEVARLNMDDAIVTRAYNDDREVNSDPADERNPPRK